MRGYSAIALHNPKTPENVGGVMRAVSCFDSSMVVISGYRFKGAPTDTCKTHKHVPLIHSNDVFDQLPHDCVPVAIEFIEGSKSLCDYQHPERAFYIFGPEDSSLGSNILDKCRDVVMVPSKFCLNLAACVNVVLYDRMMKGIK